MINWLARFCFVVVVVVVVAAVAVDDERYELLCFSEVASVEMSYLAQFL